MHMLTTISDYYEKVYPRKKGRTAPKEFEKRWNRALTISLAALGPLYGRSF